MFGLIKKILLFLFLIIFVLVTAYVLIVGYYIYKTGFQTEETDIKYYNSAICNCRDKEGCKHFPQKISDELPDIKFYYYSAGLGGQTILLEFNTDKNFVDNEIKKPIYKKLSSEEINYIFVHARGNRRNIYTNFNDFYGLKRDSKKQDNNLFTGFGGIAVNKDKTKILYYHINPEG